ncbi:MAG: response regulator [Candidatus Omnitrophica bacterium]|nr:response regulator [Candidatus Omnitrophota bacterium]
MSKIRVLMVDDEVDFLEVMKGRVESWDYDLTLATSGKDALEIIKKSGADIVILDYMMPQMDGVATLTQIRKLDLDIPVIMFTAHPDSNSIKGAEHLGVSTFVPKLSTYSDVQSSLRVALDMAQKKLRNKKG